MAELKTKQNDADVGAFIDSVEGDDKKEFCNYLLKTMSKITGEKPKMWGGSIVGFGNYHYKYDSGREGDWFVTGFSPRKQSMTLYIMSGFGRYEELMQKLGKYTTGVSCLYVKKQEHVDLDILEQLIDGSVKYMNDKYNS
ncbi:MAG: DUF1801 domain-containing protein [Cyclobacteriaceae bacterium]